MTDQQAAMLKEAYHMLEWLVREKFYSMPWPSDQYMELSPLVRDRVVRIKSGEMV